MATEADLQQLSEQYDYEQTFELTDTVWVAARSSGADRTFHTDPECITLNTEQRSPARRTLRDLGHELTPCSACVLDEQFGGNNSDAEYFSFAKALRSGELDATDIMDAETLDRPEPADRRW